MDENKELTYEEAQEAVDNGDSVTADELANLYPDLTQGQIYDKLDEDQLELEKENYTPYEKPRAAARQGRKTYNSGPKGVLTDYEEAKLKLKARRLQQQLKREKNYYMNISSSSKDNVQGFNHQLFENLLDKEFNPKNEDDINHDYDDQDQSNQKNKTNNNNNYEDDIENEDDEEILNLAKEMQKMKLLEQYKPRYGEMKEVNFNNFEKEVDQVPEFTVVIVHVYQDYLERCVRLNAALSELAKSYPHVKFLRARSDQIGLDDYPEIGLPTLIVFQNKKQVYNFIAVLNEIGNPFSVQDVENFLINKKIMRPLQNVQQFYGEQNNNHKKDQDDIYNNETELMKSDQRITYHKKKPLNSNITLKDNNFAHKKHQNNEDSDSELDL